MKKTAQLQLICLGIGLFLGMAGALGSAPIKLTNTPGWYDASPRIAVDSLGNIHVVWSQYYGPATTATTTGDAMYSKYDVITQQWTAPLNLSNNSQVHSPEYRPVGIDIDGSNNIYVIYVERGNGRVMMRIRSGGNWGAAFEVSTSAGSYDSPRVAVDPNGNVFTSWWNMNNYVCYSRARIGGTWEAVSAVSTGWQAKFCDIAVGNNMAFMTWTARDPIYRIFYTRRSTTYNASWSTPQIIATHTYKQQTPTVEVDANDVGHIIYAQCVDDYGTRRMDYSYWNGSGFSSPQAISGSTLQHYPSMCERGNNIFATWNVGAWMGGTSVNYNNRIIGSWTGEGSIAGSAGNTYPDVATSPYQDKIYYVWDSGNEIWFETKILYALGQYLIFDGSDYDGNHTADISIFRPHNTYWCIKDIIRVFFGIPGDIPVPGDYDGNGTTDIAVFRPSTGLWAAKDQFRIVFGQSGDIPVPGDYNGDGTTDIAIYRPSTGTWEVKDQFTVELGVGANIPVPGDYDGNGTTDVAVFGLASGRWTVLNQFQVVFGMPGDIPVPADYNGDNITDLAIFRPATAYWAVKDLLRTHFGLSGDFPVPGDFDGNGTADIAIFRLSEGLWAVKDQFRVYYGRDGDVPLVR